MLGEVTLVNVTEKLSDRERHDVVRLGIKRSADTIILVMYRRMQPDKDADKGKNDVTLTPLIDPGIEGDMKRLPLHATVIVDTGDFVEAVTLVTHSADRERARKEAEAESDRKFEEEARYEALKITASEATDKFEKLYAQWEDADSRRSELELEVRGLRASLEMMLETARKAGLPAEIPEPPEDDLIEQAKEAAKAVLGEEETTPVGAPGDAEDTTT